jgi:hypothetical protein
MLRGAEEIPKKQRRKLARMATLHERSQWDQFSGRTTTTKITTQHGKLAEMTTLLKGSSRSSVRADTG